jgi:hypothetical protein
MLVGTRVVASCDPFSAQSHGVIKKSLKFNFGIAKYIRVGRSTSLILAQKLGKDPLFIVSKNSRLQCRCPKHQPRSPRPASPALSAIAVIIIVFPVLHE